MRGRGLGVADTETALEKKRRRLLNPDGHCSVSSGSERSRGRNPEKPRSGDQSVGREKKNKKKKRRSLSRDRGRRVDRGPFGAGVKVAMGADDRLFARSPRLATGSCSFWSTPRSTQGGCRLVFCRRCERCSHGTGARCTLQRGGTRRLQWPPATSSRSWSRSSERSWGADS